MSMGYNFYVVRERIPVTSGGIFYMMFALCQFDFGYIIIVMRSETGWVVVGNCKQVTIFILGKLITQQVKNKKACVKFGKFVNI